MKPTIALIFGQFQDWRWGKRTLTYSGVGLPTVDRMLLETRFLGER